MIDDIQAVGGAIEDDLGEHPDEQTCGQEATSDGSVQRAILLAAGAGRARAAIRLWTPRAGAVWRRPHGGATDREPATSGPRQADAATAIQVATCSGGHQDAHHPSTPVPDRDRMLIAACGGASSGALAPVGEAHNRSRPPARPAARTSAAAAPRAPRRQIQTHSPVSVAARSPRSTTPRSSEPARCRSRSVTSATHCASRATRSSGSAGTSERRPPSNDGEQPLGRDHLPHPGGPVGGGARPPARPQRPDHQGRHRAHRSRRGDRPGHRPRGPDRNLRASEIALQGIAAKAIRISDVLEVQAQLTETRGQIETLTAQLKDLNDRAGYAHADRPVQRPDRRRRGGAAGLGPDHRGRRGVGEHGLGPPGPGDRGDLVRHRVAADPAGRRCS